MSASAKTRTRQQLELTVLGFLVGLIIKTVLDSAFKDALENCTGIHAFWAIILGRNSLEFAVFFFTLLRFMFGAWRFQEETKDDPSSWMMLWNTCMTIAVFLAFYAMGLSIKSQLLTFYEIFALAHLIDVIWFAPIILLTIKGRLKTQKPPAILRSLLRGNSPNADVAAMKFFVLDLATIVWLGLWFWRWNCLSLLGWDGWGWGGHPGSNLQGAGWGLIAIGLGDLAWNHFFYFGVPLFPPHGNDAVNF